MQIAGRPFDDATVLKTAYAYEQASVWHTRRPTLVPGAPTSTTGSEHAAEASPQIEPGLRRLVEMLVERAGLKLPEPLLLQLCEAAPYALAMVRRIPMHAWEVEPANVFRFPDSVPKALRKGS
jgi:aspartyl-tRNA(Asn)/glutamyl-tRNA(Gln) amidotransferase subunit A